MNQQIYKFIYVFRYSGLTMFGLRCSLQLAQTSQQGGKYEFAQKIVSVPYSYMAAGIILGFTYSFLNLPDADIRTLSSGSFIFA